jgi:hypothetical protein
MGEQAYPMIHQNLPLPIHIYYRVYLTGRGVCRCKLRFREMIVFKPTLVYPEYLVRTGRNPRVAVVPLLCALTPTPQLLIVLLPLVKYLGVVTSFQL